MSNSELNISASKLQKVHIPTKCIAWNSEIFSSVIGNKKMHLLNVDPKKYIISVANV